MKSFDKAIGDRPQAELNLDPAPALHGTTVKPRRAHPQARRQQAGRSKPRFSLTAAVVMAAMGVCSWRAEAQVPLNLVLDTGNNTVLPSRITANGAPILRVGASNPTVTFNGVTIRYLGTESVTPLVSDPFASGQTAAGAVGRFIVLGDLNLASNQKIFGVGPNLVRLEVGNNANIAAGATIDVSAQGGFSGAGGGAGGSVSASPLTEWSPVYPRLGLDGDQVRPVPAFGGTGGNKFTPDGQVGENAPALPLKVNGTTYTPGTAAYAALFRSVAGGAGQAGQGNAVIAAGGAERVYRTSPLGPGVADLVLATLGQGGTAGSRGGTGGIFGGGNGDPGGRGSNGGDGARGLAGANATAIQGLLNATVVSLHGGNGGGAGATGGAGLPGGDGGGGGGGGASATSVVSGDRAAGGSGGLGGLAGQSGAAGLGGQGGGGGGGIQLVVRGTLNLASGAGVLATGGNGGAGQTGGAGGVGGAGGSGQSGFGDFLQRGGSGGNAGNGGTGGNGGNGGYGIGGTGGVVQIVSSSLTFNGYASTQGGLSGNGIDRSANGETFIHAYSGTGTSFNTSTYFGARAAGDNPYRSFASTVAFGGAPAGLVPNVPSIVGGAAPYGLLAGETAAPGVTPLTIAEGVKFVTDIVAPAPAGQKRVGAVTRVSVEWVASSFGIEALNNNNQQLILFSAFNSDVARPALMAVDPSHAALFGDYVPTGPIRLRQGNGYLNDPSITPGAVAPTDLAVLPARSTFAMYASGTQNITAAFSPYGYARYFSGTPTPSGNFAMPGPSTIFLVDKGLLYLGVNARSNDTGQGQGFITDKETTGNFEGTVIVNLRAGGNNVVTASVQGTGNADTATSGNAVVRTRQRPGGVVTEPGPLYTQATARYEQVGVGQDWGMATQAINTAGLAIGTTQRVAEVDFTPEYDETARTVTAQVDARIFGPSPRLQGAGTSGNSFSFADIQAGTAVISRFNLQNADVLSSINSLWRNAIRQSPELIRLTILGYELIDPDGVFSLSSLGNFPLPFTLDGNQLAPIDIRFSPRAEGHYSATLRLLTDLNAPLGLAGDYFAVSLFATAVDEPPAVILLLGGWVVLLIGRKGRSAGRAR